jgi:hypothetical protein
VASHPQDITVEEAGQLVARATVYADKHQILNAQLHVEAGTCPSAPGLGSSMQSWTMPRCGGRLASRSRFPPATARSWTDCGNVVIR